MPVPQLKFFRALWGAEAQFSTDIDHLFTEFHRLGYAGVEATLSDIHRICQNDHEAFRRALHDNQLELIGLVQTTYPTIKNDIWQDLSIDEHLANLENHFEEFMQYKPIHVNIQGGQDSWSIEENEQFFEKALEVQAKYPQVTSSHETHRSRSLYNPFITAHIVKRFPTLRLTADYSHFMLVCERLLEHPTDDERFRLFASRIDHLHARVGSTQHAQVNDPLESKKESEQMQRWWEMIWDAQKNRTWITLTPEYGPVPYAITSEINVWDLTNREMERQKKNYAKWSNKVQ
ncbi:unnamed protein product [Didymodactylos carnosus]|uniref:Xylose isomerase n=1 Tax=Didymodactylos carnosus TaxID=1234261 RepID=A0A814XM97_9BILA|nr:unnamed protein product [Didymodactylos carnosus]CAF1217486.1 unnamed protein product [Didymodactylos carnosus]CAF3787293.1 unnamed protein product [Didymodactylos carnosus]CAF3981174.1 unnamed protein product [Didymodactylos carnosus]